MEGRLVSILVNLIDIIIKKNTKNILSIQKHPETVSCTHEIACKTSVESGNRQTDCGDRCDLLPYKSQQGPLLLIWIKSNLIRYNVCVELLIHS